MDLAVYIENVVKGFSRYHKYTIGSDLRNLSREVVNLIIAVNSRKEVMIINMQGSKGLQGLQFFSNCCRGCGKPQQAGRGMDKEYKAKE